MEHIVLLILCWAASPRYNSKEVAWERVTNLDTLYSYILQRNKSQLLKALDYHFATGSLAHSLGRDGHGLATDQILDGTIDKYFIHGVDHSNEIGNFMAALASYKYKGWGASGKI